MRAFLVAFTLGALALAGTAGATIIQFHTPSGNIGCAYSSGVYGHGASLRCDILSGLKPRPAKPRGCDVDWGFGYQMYRTGRARTVCAGDTAVDRRSKTLKYGQSWSFNGFKCTSREAGLRCHNRSGHGLFLSREHSYRF